MNRDLKGNRRKPDDHHKDGSDYRINRGIIDDNPDDCNDCLTNHQRKNDSGNPNHIPGMVAYKIFRRNANHSGVYNSLDQPDENAKPPAERQVEDIQIQ